MPIYDEDYRILSLHEVDDWDSRKELNRRAILLIDSIKRGRTLITPREYPVDVFAGDVYYDSKGEYPDCIVVVFNDCNDWDYFDHFVFANGDTLDFDNMVNEVVNYNPETYDELIGVWHFPAFKNRQEEEFYRWH